MQAAYRQGNVDFLNWFTYLQKTFYLEIKEKAITQKHNTYALGEYRTW